MKDFLPPLFISFVARSSTVQSLTVAKSIRLPLGAAESRDGMTTKQRSRGGAVMFAYEMWKERNIRPQTCLHFDKCIKQCIKCIGEKNNWKYRSYQASIDPIPIPTLVSILSIFGSIRTPLTDTWLCDVTHALSVLSKSNINYNYCCYLVYSGSIQMCIHFLTQSTPVVLNPWPAGCMRPVTNPNAAHHAVSGPTDSFAGRAP